MGDVERALLTHWAFHSPEGIERYEQQLWYEAESDDFDDATRERGRRMLEAIRAEGVLIDDPQSERGSREEHGENRWEPSPGDGGGS